MRVRRRRHGQQGRCWPEGDVERARAAAAAAAAAVEWEWHRELGRAGQQHHGAHLCGGAPRRHGVEPQEAQLQLAQHRFGSYFRQPAERPPGRLPGQPGRCHDARPLRRRRHRAAAAATHGRQPGPERGRRRRRRRSRSRGRRGRAAAPRARRGRALAVAPRRAARPVGVQADGAPLRGGRPQLPHRRHGAAAARRLPLARPGLGPPLCLLPAARPAHARAPRQPHPARPRGIPRHVPPDLQV